MTSKDAVLNIAVNLGRIAKYIETNRLNRAVVFSNDNKQYVSHIKTSGVSQNVKKSLKAALSLSNGVSDTNSANVPDDFYTYANILTHRARLFV